MFSDFTNDVLSLSNPNVKAYTIISLHAESCLRISVPRNPPAPVIEVVANGMITKWGDSCTIQIETGKEIELSISDDIEIASGYFPKEGDIIEFRYQPENMIMTSIDLKGRKGEAYVGWITAFGDGKCKILYITGEENELIFDEQTDILLGYTPAVDDFVLFKTDDEQTILTYIRFLSHPKNIDESELHKTVLELAQQRAGDSESK